MTASKMKKALRIKSSKKSPGKEINPAKGTKCAVTVGELMKIQMDISEHADSRIRRALLWVAASQTPNQAVEASPPPSRTRCLASTSLSTTMTGRSSTSSSTPSALSAIATSTRSTSPQAPVYHDPEPQRNGRWQAVPVPSPSSAPRIRSAPASPLSSSPLASRVPSLGRAVGLSRRLSEISPSRLRPLLHLPRCSLPGRPPSKGPPPALAVINPSSSPPPPPMCAAMTSDPKLPSLVRPSPDIGSFSSG